MENHFNCQYWPAYLLPEYMAIEYEPIVDLLQLVSSNSPFLSDDADLNDIDILTYLPITNKRIRANRYERVILDEHNGLCDFVGTAHLRNKCAILDGHFGTDHIINKQSPYTIKNNGRLFVVNNIISIKNHFIDHSGQILLDSKGVAYEYKFNTMQDIIEYREFIHPNGWAKINQAWDQILFLSNDGELYTKGPNRYGQCGYRCPSRTFVPKHVDLSHLGKNVKVRSIASGVYISGIVLSDGRVAVCGSGRGGQLGLGSTKCRKHFTVVPNIINAIEIAMGHNHFIVLLRSGHVLSWGTYYADPNSNLRGGNEIGRDCRNNTDRSTPNYIKLPLPAIDICAGLRTTMILLKDSSVVAFGEYCNMEFGFENPFVTHNIDAINIACGIRFGMILCRDGSIKCLGNEYSPWHKFLGIVEYPADIQIGTRTSFY